MPTTRYTFKISPDVAIVCEAESQTDAFRQWAAASEVFGGTTCGACGEDATPRVRTVEGNHFHELKCLCGAVRAFGVNRTGGGLFPKRKDAEGRWLPDDGWVRWPGSPS